MNKAWVDFFIVLCFGWAGVHKFIQGNKKMGVVYLCTLGLLGCGWLYDCVVYLLAAVNGKRIIIGGGFTTKTLREDEELPVVESRNVPLQKGEVCHYVGTVKYQTTKNVVTGYTGASQGVNIRIAKGLSYRTGGHGSKAIREDVVEQTQGTLSVTNKRVIFTATKGAFDAKYSKISSVDPHSDGIIIQIGSKAYTLICKDARYIHELIMRASANAEE